MKWLLGLLVVLAVAVVAAIGAFALTGDNGGERVDKEALARERQKARRYMRDLEQALGQPVTQLVRLGKDYWRVRFGANTCMDIRLDRPRKREVEIVRSGRC